MLIAMKRADIEHLATLARIRLSEEEKERLPEELSSIVAYVSVVSDMVGAAPEAEPMAGVVKNVFRADAVTNTPDQYTQDILAEMPETDGRYLKVKKILNTEE